MDAMMILKRWGVYLFDTARSLTKPCLIHISNFNLQAEMFLRTKRILLVVSFSLKIACSSIVIGPLTRF